MAFTVWFVCPPLMPTHAVRLPSPHLGIPMAEIAAFGDGTNDLTMVQFAGIGVAMDNGAEKLKQVADQVAPSNVEHGVAQVLKNWFGTTEEL